MALAVLKDALPDYARDIRLNLDSTIAVSTLPEQRLWGTVVATAIASRHARTRRELEEEASHHLGPEALAAAKAAAAVMAMNNVYYTGKRLLAEGGVTGYDDIPARLRMQVIGSHGGVDAADFEFWCFAVSAINGCGDCLVAHERTVRDQGVSREQCHEALRIASVVHAVALTLESEEGPAA